MAGSKNDLKDCLTRYRQIKIKYKNVLQNPSIRIDARGTEAEFRATPITEAKAVKSVVERFREKYGAKDVKKYYSKFDVAVKVALGRYP